MIDAGDPSFFATSMLSVSIHMDPSKSSVQGCVRYHACSSSFDVLEVHCSGTELCVSVSKEKKVLCQFCIGTPEGLLKPFSASTAPEKQLPLPTQIESDRRGGAASDAQLVSKFSALTTVERDLPTKTDVINTTNDSRTHSTETPKDGPFGELSFCSELSDAELLDRVGADACAPVTVREFLMDRIKADTPFDILCTACDRILTGEAVRFERVEECCEGLTSELSESFYCHAETAAVEVAVTRSLYFDSMYYYLHASVLKELSILQLDDRRFACGACDSSLSTGGRPVQGFTQFFCDKLQFRSSDSSPGDLSYPFRLAWVTLWGLIESTFQTSLICKLYLHSKAAEGDTCLLLCVLPEKVPWFLLRAASSARADFQTEEAYRVHYLVSAPSSQAVRTWRHDFDVDFYKVSDSAMSVFVRYLAEASACLSGKTRADGFATAFLPASFPGTRRFLNKG